MERLFDELPRFKFKKFEMLNSVNGLKIGTDGVLLGAWAEVSLPGTVWDVGCGTGVIGLMLVQRCKNSVIGFEIEDFAAQIATENVRISPWCDRMKVEKGDVFDISELHGAPDLIVSNPPFFERNRALKAATPERDLARRVNSLSFSSLIKLAAEKLSQNGELCMVSPFDCCESIEWELALAKLFVRRKTTVLSKLGKRPIRILWQCSRRMCDTINSELVIRDENGEFTEDYIQLTKEYYINF